MHGELRNLGLQALEDRACVVRRAVIDDEDVGFGAMEVHSTHPRLDVFLLAVGRREDEFSCHGLRLPDDRRDQRLVREGLLHPLLLRRQG